MSPENKLLVVYGGTFDPFHLGHEAICQSILAHSFVDQLQLIPCHVPALKAQATATGRQRLEMLYEWQRDQSKRLVVDSIEIEREGPSYTFETVLALKQRYPGFKIVIALGADAWQSLPHWQGYDELRQLISVWVFTRLGQEHIQPLLGWLPIKESSSLSKQKSGSYFIDHSVQMDVSSAFIRKGPETLDAQVPSTIFKYIQKYNLYPGVCQNEDKPERNH